jgi:anaerobic selenocysteine-containing dehydrogenase
MGLTLAARRKVLVAADHVPTRHPREAAILGGIVRCAIDIGRIDSEFVRRYTADIINEFNLVNVDRRMPGRREIEMVLERFQAEYRRPYPAER